MADLTISPDVIRDALKDFVAAYEPAGAAATEVGTVVDAADGIAHVEGLPGVMANELVRFENGIEGLALNLDEAEIGVVVLGDFSKIEEGQEVKRTGEVLSVPVGDNFLGRVVNPLGQPIDGLGEITGIAWPYGTVDRVGDVIEKGAFTTCVSRALSPTLTLERWRQTP